MTPEITNFPRIPRVTEGAHCTYCVMDDETVSKIKQIVLIFLDMDGVMVADRFSGETSRNIRCTARMMFGGGNITQFQWRLAASPHLDKKPVRRLMGLIHAIEAAGRRVGIVISSAWRCDGTTMQVCHKMFACQPFSPYIIGRTASKQSYDPQYALVTDKMAFLENIKRKYGLELTNRGYEIRHWLAEHSAGQDYVIFDDWDDRIRRLFNKRFIQTYYRLKHTHIDEALTLFGIKVRSRSHCAECTMKPEEDYKISDRTIFFLDVDELIDEGTLTEPLGNHLIQFLIRIKPGQETQFYDISNTIPVNPWAERSLSYLLDKVTALGHKVGIVLLSKWSNLTTKTAIIHRFRWMFFHPFLLGMTRNGKKGVGDWVKRHEIAHYAILNVAEQFGRGDKHDVDAFIRNLGMIKKIVPPNERLHCNFCILDHSEVASVKDMIVIYLDIEGILIGRSNCLANSSSRSHPWQVLPAHLLDANAVDRLMFLIRFIERKGKQVGIVLTSDWRTSETTENVCSVMFASQPFNRNLIGRTSSPLETDPEMIRMNSSDTHSKVRLAFYAVQRSLSSKTMEQQIEFWAIEHGSENRSIVFHRKKEIFLYDLSLVVVDERTLLGWQEISRALWKLPDIFVSRVLPATRHCKSCLLESNQHKILKEGIILFVDSEEIDGASYSFNWRTVDRIMQEISVEESKGLSIGLVLYNTSWSDSTKRLCTKKFAVMPFGDYLIGNASPPPPPTLNQINEGIKNVDPMQIWIDEHRPLNFRKVT